MSILSSILSFKKSIKITGEIWRYLSKTRKRQTLCLGFLMIIGGFFEAVSLGAVVPFLAVVSSPQKIEQSESFQKIYLHLQRIGLPKTEFGGDNFTSLVTIFASFLIVTVILSGWVRMLLVWQGGRLANLAGAEISLELYRRILYRPYIRFTQENSANLISNIAAKNGLVVISMTAMLTLLVSFIIVSSIFFTLLLIQPLVTVLVGLLIGSSYGLFLVWSRAIMKEQSSKISLMQDAIFLKLQEGLGGIRDIILDGAQETYIGIFKSSIYPLRLAFAKVNFLSQSPRFVVESLALVLFVGLAWWAQAWGQGAMDLIPFLGALALGAQRLLPALQQGYAAWTTILAYSMVTQDTLKILNEVLPTQTSQTHLGIISLKKQIDFENVKFRYSSNSQWVLNGVSLVISKGSRVGFEGETGSGKSTCLDLLMGLLEPTEGRILIDGAPLTHANLRAWQRNIAHVPQAIFLSDNTLAENIAFGIPVEKIDMNRVEEAARQAQIADFIESSPLGYQALVGERGIRLSGGQRQRIGIARALYKQAQVLVFDEATSALDHNTEDAVMRSINSLSSDLTILIIAHRTSTLKNCDQIINLGSSHIKKTADAVQIKN